MNKQDPIGIMLLDGDDPRIPGQVASSKSFQFPVLYDVLEGIDAERIFYHREGNLAELVLEKASNLVNQGAVALTSNCGFLGYYQKIVSSHIDVPVMLSSLLQIPIIKNSLKPDQNILILTAESTQIDDKLLSAVGVQNSNLLKLLGLQDNQHFKNVFITHKDELSPPTLEREIVRRVKNVAVEENIGAVLVECAVLPPYSKTIQEALDLPVFDFLTMIRYLRDGMTQVTY